MRFRHGRWWVLAALAASVTARMLRRLAWRRLGVRVMACSAALGLVLAAVLLVGAGPAGAHDPQCPCSRTGVISVPGCRACACSAPPRRHCYAAIAARRACYEARLRGATCDVDATEAAVRAARDHALDAIEAGCSEAQAVALRAPDVHDLLADAIRACRQIEGDVVASAFAPLGGGADAIGSAAGSTALAQADPAAERCMVATAAAARSSAAMPSAPGAVPSR